MDIMSERMPRRRQTACCQQSAQCALGRGIAMRMEKRIMESWQATRLRRAQEQEILVTRVDRTPESFIFDVQGVSGNYEVEIYEDVDFWPPRCSCEDNMWRGGDVLCKHILVCLKLMGVDEASLSDCRWEPTQEEVFDFLCNAPDCVGGSICPGDFPRETHNISASHWR